MNPCCLILLWDSYFPLCFVTSRHWDSIEAESPAPMQLLLDQTQSKRKTRGTSGIRRSTIRTIARLRENPSGHCWLPWEVNWQLRSSMEPGLPAQENMPAETGLFSCWWSFVQEPSLVKCHLVVISYMGLSGNEVYSTTINGHEIVRETIFLTIQFCDFPLNRRHIHNHHVHHLAFPSYLNPAIAGLWGRLAAIQLGHRDAHRLETWMENG